MSLAREKTPERRQHHRFPVVEGLIEPVTLRFPSEANGKAESHPAIMTNLSAGGMSLITFLDVPHAKKLELEINLPGLLRTHVEGKILRIHEKEEVFSLGIGFTKIQKRDMEKINRMAQNYSDCETRISYALPEVCLPECVYHPLCTKPQKMPSAHPKRS